MFDNYKKTDNELKKEFQELANNHNIPIANESKFSAFWVFLQNVAINCYQQIWNFVLNQALPSAFVKTATAESLELLASTYDIRRKEPTKLVGSITFNRVPDSQNEIIIPKGSVVKSIPINGTIYRLISTHDAILASNNKSCLVNFEAEQPGSSYNLGAGYYSILDIPLSGIESVINTADYIQSLGADVESDEALRERIREKFLSVGSWHTDAKYKSMVAEFAGISVDKIFIDHNSIRDGETSHLPGSADILIMFDDSNDHSNTISNVNSYIRDYGMHGHGDDVLIREVPRVDYELTLNILFRGSYNLEEVKNFIRCKFNENNDFAKFTKKVLPLSRFSISELMQELHNYFDNIETIHSNSVDTETKLNILKLTTLNIEVVNEN